MVFFDDIRYNSTLKDDFEVTLFHRQHNIEGKSSRERVTVFFGVDVSEADGNVKWHQMMEQGIGFAMLCAGYGSGSIDLQFRKNAELCNRLGIPCGAYWISYAYTEEMARREAEFCIETVEEFGFALPLCVKYDCSSVRYAESKGIKVTEEFTRKLMRTFCRRAEEKGYVSMYYVELNKCEMASDT